MGRGGGDPTHSAVLIRSDKCSTAGEGFSSPSSTTTWELLSPDGMIKGAEMSREGRGMDGTIISMHIID